MIKGFIFDNKEICDLRASIQDSYRRVKKAIELLEDGEAKDELYVALSELKRQYDFLDELR